MIMAKEIVITEARKRELEEELNYRKGDLADEISKKISEARAQGDLSENAEYHAAREAQGKNEARIKEIEHTIRTAKLIKDEDISENVIGVGNVFKILDVEMDEELEFEMVGESANALENKISKDSPVGGALEGHQKGDVVKVAIGDRTLEFKVLDVRRK